MGQKFAKVRGVALSTALLGLMPSVASAQANGALTVTANVETSVSLRFETDAAGVTLSGAGTSAATMDFGTVSAYGTIAASGVTRTVGAANFTVSSPFGVHVTSANGTSPNYVLAAALASADATNTWTMNATVLTTSNQVLGSTYGYSSTVQHTLYLTVPFSAAAGALSRVINLTATPN
jgi:hypothetical protein